MSEPRRALERAGFCRSITERLASDLQGLELAAARSATSAAE
jgi:hypothetical protein